MKPVTKVSAFRTFRTILTWASPLILVVAAYGFWALRITDGPATQDAPTGAGVFVASEAAKNGQAKDSTVPITQGTEVGDGDCLSPEQLETHPMLAEEVARIETVTYGGPTVEAYRGLSRSSIEGLAIQGDSASMAVLGAMSLLAAQGIDEQYAVPLLLSEDVTLYNWQPAYLERPESRQHLLDARQWFYEAALHGRLLTLYWVGEVEFRLQNDAVELGWVDEADYVELGSRERSALYPQNVYNQVAYEIAPQLRSGLSGFLQEMVPSSEQQQDIVIELARQFEEDRTAAGLPPAAVEESVLPSWEELRNMICESYIEGLE